MTSQWETRLPILARRTLALVNVRTICPVVLTTLTARKLVDVLGMVGARLPSIPDDYLPVSVREPDVRSSHRLGTHKETSGRRYNSICDSHSTRSIGLRISMSIPNRSTTIYYHLTSSIPASPGQLSSGVDHAIRRHPARESDVEAPLLTCGGRSSMRSWSLAFIDLLTEVVRDSDSTAKAVASALEYENV